VGRLRREQGSRKKNTGEGVGLGTILATLREHGWTRDEVLDMTLPQIEMYLHLAMKSDVDRAQIHAAVAMRAGGGLL